jgi:hypothetical protein
VCVCATARQGSVQTAYLKWMGDESRARFVELRETLKLLGGDAKLNFENLARVPDAERPGCVRRLPHCLALCIALLCSMRGQSSGRLPPLSFLVYLLYSASCVVRALVACPHRLSLCRLLGGAHGLRDVRMPLPCLVHLPYSAACVLPALSVVRGNMSPLDALHAARTCERNHISFRSHHMARIAPAGWLEHSG